MALRDPHRERLHDPTITLRYKHTTVKQYLKEGLALRTDTTVNDTLDFDTGQRLENLPEVRVRGEATNDGLLEQEADTEVARLEGPELSDLVRPTIREGRCVAAHRLGDPRANRYRLTADGLRQRALLTKLAARVLDPGLARCGPPIPEGERWQAFDRLRGRMLERANIAA